MKSIIHGLNWFPSIPDKFVTWGSEIQLYKIQSDCELEKPFVNTIGISSKHPVTLLASENRFQYIRCLEVSFKDDALVAAGLASGKVGLCNFNQGGDNNLEFTPRQQRTCLCLAWNEVDKDLLAIGHDRSRSDYCISVWDTERGVSKESITNLIGLSETAHSLCWDKNNKVLISGMSQKNIKLYDLRQNNTNFASVGTRMVYGLCMSPSGNYLASYVDTIIGLWDIRNIEKPLTTIPTSKNITNLSWCPTRMHMLSTVQRESPYIHITEIYCTEIDGTVELYPRKKYVAPFHNRNCTNAGRSSLLDLSWHPVDLERALVVSDTGAVIDFKIPPRVAVSWDISNNLVAISHILQKQVSTPSSASSLKELSLNDSFIEDIADMMHKRALNDYGLLSDIGKNGDLARDNNLKIVWKLLCNMAKEDNLLGLKNILNTNAASEGPQIFRSEAQTLSWPDFISSSSMLVTYKSEQRNIAQNLCGWIFENDVDLMLNKFIPELCSRKEFSRAAMICVFHLKIKQAIEILSKGADQSNDPSILRMAAIALSGFNADLCSAIWRSQRLAVHNQINDSHLRALFGFLTVENENYDAVVMEKGISLADRVAFACKYLNDTKLVEYIKTMIQVCTKQGDLNGLLLTGDSSEGINILQSYLDLTEDLQTVSLIAIRFFHLEVLTDYRVQYWISSYLDLLDAWGLWEKRAELDIKIEKSRSQTKPSKSVFLLCNFCGKSVSAALQDDVRIRSSSSNINKLSSCPSCRKPLPRCSLCLLHMGTTTHIPSQSAPGHESLGWQSKPFSKWFSWCQTCRHGGHTEHLTQWFKEHSECPVTGCSCKCFAMDLPLQKFSRDNA